MRVIYSRKAWLLVALIALSYAFSYAKCNEATARNVWTDIYLKCVTNDALRLDQLVYLGPSNRAGAGTIYHRFPNGLQPAAEFADYVPSNTDRQKILTQPGLAACRGSAHSSTEINAKAVLESQITPASGEFGLRLARSRSVDLAFSQYEQVDVKEIPFKLFVDALPGDNAYRNNLLKPDYVVATKAFRVSGFSATVTFESAVEPAFKAKYTGNVGALGSAGVNFSATWKSDTQLELSAQSDFIIASEISRYVGTGFQGEQGHFEKVSLNGLPVIPAQ